MAHRNRPEDEPHRTVHLKSLVLSQSASRCIIGQEPIGADLGCQRESLSLSRVEQARLQPTPCIVEVCRGNQLREGEGGG
jgi:hypothetical protein